VARAVGHRPWSVVAGIRWSTGATLVAVLALVATLVAPVAAVAAPDRGPAAVAPSSVEARGPYAVGSASAALRFGHRAEAQPVEVWYPADAAAAAAAPRAEHRFADGIADVVRHLPVDLVVDLMALAGITEIDDLFDLVDQLGLELGLDAVRDLLPLLRLLGLTEIGPVLAFVGITTVGELLDLVGLGGVIADITVPPVPAPTARAAPTLLPGDHPLVVFSHELGAVRWQSLELVEALASHGYVVAAVDHPGTTLGTPLGFADLAGPIAPVDAQLVARARDVTALIDAIGAGDVAPVLPAGRVRTGDVAVVGHSLGALTALLSASGTTRGGQTVAADERVAALVGLAPLTEAGRPLITDAELAAIDQPTLLIAGTADVRTPIDPNVTRPVSLLAGDRVHRVDLTGAGHDVFADAFPGLDLALLLGLARGALDGRSGPVPGPGATPAARSAVDPHLAGPFPSDAATRAYTQQVVAGFLAEVLPTDGHDPGDPGDPGDPDPRPGRSGRSADPVDPADPVVPQPPTSGDGAPVTFSDVDPRSVHHQAIVALATDGIIGGYPDGTFRPGRDVTRAQLAAIVARAAGLPRLGSVPFGDVTGSPHAPDIAALVAAGIVTGYPDGTFRPNEPVRRDHVAAILARWLEAGSGDGSVFVDLGRNPHAGAVGALHELGVVRGLTADRYGPDRPVRRDQLASLVDRARPHAP
jgi:predicted dienelactone hydrolase